VLSDAELVSGLRAGERRAGESLIDRYYGRVLRFFHNKAPSAANDLAQRTFLGCFEGLARLRDDSKFRAFLFAIACNQLRKHYRHDRIEGEQIDFGTVSAVDLDPSPSGVVAERDEQRVLLAALRRIPVEYQIVLELAYWEDMTAVEIADVLELPLGTAKTRIRRGRQLLEAALAEVGAGATLTSTLSDLDAWARSLRDGLGR
jgi:RNA polymerase sigma-70 factor (ECF subfamily)